MELITKLGIDWKLLLAQIVNFLIVLGVLYRFLYKPLVKHLDDRRNRIAASLKEVERIEAEVKGLIQLKAEAVRTARQQAQEILKAAEADALVRRQEILDRVKTEAAVVVTEARGKFEAERDEALRTLRHEAASLVVQAVTKVVGKMPTSDVDKKLIDEAVEELSRRRPS